MNREEKYQLRRLVVTENRENEGSLRSSRIERWYKMYKKGRIMCACGEQKKTGGKRKTRC